MATFTGLYDPGREGFLAGELDWDANDIRVILINTGNYPTCDPSHKFLSSIPSNARVAVSGSLASKTVTNGVANGANVTFSAVSGATVGALVIYYHTGSDATARLIAMVDTATGLPLTPNGGDITIAWDAGTNKIFKL